MTKLMSMATHPCMLLLDGGTWMQSFRAFLLAQKCFESARDFYQNSVFGCAVKSGRPDSDESSDKMLARLENADFGV